MPPEDEVPSGSPCCGQPFRRAGREKPGSFFFFPSQEPLGHRQSSLRTGGIYFLFSLTELPYAKINSLQRGRNWIGAARAHKTLRLERLVLLSRLFFFFS